ncbi:MAG: Gfo/Idh/MocA family oxidoreductase [Candidatus Brocadiae bacterium]|nr:Gfo/Idh/MocA family oxidoreductase [Candidatus Brocadiia bacterium]
MDKLRFGVIGLGTFGEVHLQAYGGHPAAELAAVCDLDEERLEAMGEQYGVEDRFTDYRDLLAVEGLDAVSVVTPDFAHADIVVDAINSRKAVLVEKPLATTIEDCDRIGEALRANPVPFMVDFHNRWNPGVSRMRDAIEAGDIGEVQMVYYRLSDTIFVPTQMLSWAGSSSLLWFLCSHCLDTLRWLLEDEVTRVYTVSRSRVLKGMDIDTADYYVSVVEFGGGARALIENCWILPDSNPSMVDFKLEVIGEKGGLYFDPSPERLLKSTGREISTVDTYVCLRVHGKAVGFAVESVLYFVDCLQAGREPMVGFEDGREVTRIVLAMEESVQEGQPVDL